MGISALTLGGWIAVYCGISLLRTALPESQSSQASSVSRKRLVAAGYGLVVLGLVILARALLHHRFH